MEVQRDGSLEKGSVDLVIPSSSGANGGALEGAANIHANHNTISYNDHNDINE
jgi:hypothetical protein